MPKFYKRKSDSYLEMQYDDPALATIQQINFFKEKTIKNNLLFRIFLTLHN